MLPKDFQYTETSIMCDMNKKASDVLSNTLLIGKRCYIIAGGPSLKDKFNFSSIPNSYTIGMNKTYMHYPTNICFFWDYDLYQDITQGTLDNQTGKKYKETFTNFSGLKIFLAQPARLKYEYGVYVVNRIIAREIISLDVRDGIYGGNNSCFASIMLAISLGCKEIYLLGVDMKVTDRTHWHEGYNHSLAEFKERCLIFKKELDIWAPRWKTAGIDIIQLVMDRGDETSLTCFPKIKLTDHLKFI